MIKIQDTEDSLAMSTPWMGRLSIAPLNARIFRAIYPIYPAHLLVFLSEVQGDLRTQRKPTRTWLERAKLRIELGTLDLRGSETTSCAIMPPSLKLVVFFSKRFSASCAIRRTSFRRIVLGRT